MTETELLALKTMFMAAVVAAGLSLSYVPHVELVTLVVFASGVLLGSRRGAWVGAVGMVLYVFANSALKGFAPSPLPILLAQAAAASLPGLAGGLWRRWWLSGASARRWALRALPLVGLLLAAAGQTVLNLAFAFFLAAEGTGRLAAFWVGMASGGIDMGVNLIVFAVAGPRVVSGLRRLARDRGWWGRTVAGLAVLLGLIISGPAAGAGADEPPVPSAADTLAVSPAAAADTLVAPTVVDPDPLTTPSVVDPDTLTTPSVAGDETSGAPAAAGEDSLEAEGRTGAASGSARRSRSLRPLQGPSSPLWQPLPTAEASVQGAPSLRAGSLWPAAERSLTPDPAVSPAVERWGIGWGRTRFAYDGIPLSGPVHDGGEPPDLPLAWRGRWRERWTATGTSLHLAAPAPVAEQALSQVSLTTGSLGRRTAEFGLFRNLGPVNLGVDFGDREEQGFYLLNESTGSRVWIAWSRCPAAVPTGRWISPPDTKSSG